MPLIDGPMLSQSLTLYVLPAEIAYVLHAGVFYADDEDHITHLVLTGKRHAALTMPALCMPWKIATSTSARRHNGMRSADAVGRSLWARLVRPT